jgi:putative transposase
LLSNAAGGFGTSNQSDQSVNLGPLHAKIGRQALEIDFLENALTKAVIARRREMIDRTHKLSIRRQAELLNISRGTVYYLPKPISAV